MLVFALIIVVGYVSYQMFVGSIRAAYDICVTTAQEALSDSTQMSCGLKREILEEFASCIVVVQKESNVKAYLYSPLGYKSQVDTLIETHNEECPASRVKLPSEGVYLEY